MSEPRKLGELVVVAIEARNLSTRDFIGKGDPFVTFRVGEDAKRIKAEKRGGQTPKWDEEVRFSIMEPGSKKMKIQVFNEDKREHDLIGDAIIDLAQVLDKCEWDEWHEIRYRNKYAGEVLLEMTFYYTEKPPSAQVQTAAAGVANHSRPQPTLPPQAQATLSAPPNSYGPNATHYTPPITNQAPTSAPPSTGYPPTPAPPSTGYPPTSAPPSTGYPPTSAPPSTGYPPSNIYPPPNSKSPPPSTHSIYSTSPPQSQPPKFFGPQRTQSPVSNQYPPVSSSGYPPPVSQGQNVYPAQGAQGYPPPYNVTPPQSNSSQGINMAFPVPVPTPNGPPGFGGQYPSYNNGYPPAPRPPLSGGYQQAPYPPNNIYPPSTGGNVYPPPNNQGYPPNPYPPGPY